ncbi:helix-turn-helix transcriptional regulator [Humisphaera borealis]|nr:helix-turn-helix transcriptional regulator [Humisphaera borealis]
MGSSVRIGDLRAAARMIARIEEPAKLGIGQKRQLLAQICRVIGEQIRAASGITGLVPTSDHAAVPAPAVALAAEESATTTVNVRLSPRMQQTLDRLLKGDSEKQVAAHLGVSPHTVHVYVKAIYRKLGVASRGELLARFVRA